MSLESALKSLQMYFMIAPALYLVNTMIATSFAIKYKDDAIYKKNALIWFFYLLLGLSQGILQSSDNLFVKTLAWSGAAYFVISFMAAFLADILKITNNYMRDIYIFVFGMTTTVVLFNTIENVCLAALPSTLVAAYPVLKFAPQLKNIKKHSMTKNGLLICYIAVSIHVVDYAYFVNKPEFLFTGYLLALMLAIGASCFSFAVLVERAIIDVEVKDLLYNTARLSALGAMAAEITHEIKNPLTVLALNNYQLKQQLQAGRLDEIYLKNKFEVTDRMTKRLMTIMDGLKTNFQSGDHDDLVEVSLSEIFEETKILCESRASRLKISLSFNEKIKDIAIECRAVQVSQVLQNLIQNAMDAIEEHKSPDRWVAVEASLVEKDHVQIVVSDSGPGIPDSIRFKVFDSLFTTKSNGKGTGLGLSISRRFVEEHGGSLLLEDAQQTRFVITLPVHQLVSQKTRARLSG